MHSYRYNKKKVQYASRSLAFKSHLLLLKIFEVDVLEVLRWLALYVIINMSETSNTKKSNRIETRGISII
jgi:hypothetical protein